MLGILLGMFCIIMVMVEGVGERSIMGRWRSRREYTLRRRLEEGDIRLWFVWPVNVFCFLLLLLDAG